MFRAARGPLRAAAMRRASALQEVRVMGLCLRGRATFKDCHCCAAGCKIWRRLAPCLHIHPARGTHQAFACRAPSSCRVLTNSWPPHGPPMALPRQSMHASNSGGGTLMLLPASLLSPSDAAAGVRTRGSRPCPCRRRTPPRRGPDASESADAEPEGASGSRSRLTCRRDWGCVNPIP